jgi:hypothetical protein
MYIFTYLGHKFAKMCHDDNSVLSGDPFHAYTVSPANNSLMTHRQHLRRPSNDPWLAVMCQQILSCAS